MAKAETNHHLEVAGQPVDLDKMTKSLESHNTTMLESVLGKTHSTAERESILSLVQQVNAERRAANPNMHLSVLTFEPHMEGDKKVLELLAGTQDQGPSTIYEEFDYPKLKGDVWQPVMVGVHDGDGVSTQDLIRLGLELYWALQR